MSRRFAGSERRRVTVLWAVLLTALLLAGGCSKKSGVGESCQKSDDCSGSLRCLSLKCVEPEGKAKPPLSEVLPGCWMFDAAEALAISNLDIDGPDWVKQWLEKLRVRFVPDSGGPWMMRFEFASPMLEDDGTPLDMGILTIKSFQVDLIPAEQGVAAQMQVKLMPLPSAPRNHNGEGDPGFAPAVEVRDDSPVTFAVTVVDAKTIESDFNFYVQLVYGLRRGPMRLYRAACPSKSESSGSGEVPASPRAVQLLAKGRANLATRAAASGQLAPEVPVVAGKPLGYRGCDRVCVPRARCELAKSGQTATDCATEAKVQCPALLRDTPQYREWWLNCNYECNTKGPNSMAPQDCDPQEPASGPRSDNKADR